MAIHKIEAKDGRSECYVIASGGLWLPGAYESERAARYAFRFPNETLVKLRDAAIARGGDRVITMDDLRAERAASRRGA
jgi:hypothetical protein